GVGRVVELQLDGDLPGQALGQPVEPDERGAADGLGDVVQQGGHAMVLPEVGAESGGAGDRWPGTGTTTRTAASGFPQISLCQRRAGLGFDEPCRVTLTYLGQLR